MADTSIKFSSVETAVSDLVGTAADTFEQSFEDLKKQRFESYISLVQDFADIISKAGQATQATAQALEADATQNLFS